MSFPNDHTSSWPEPSSQPSLGWRANPSNLSRHPTHNSSVSLFPAASQSQPVPQHSAPTSFFPSASQSKSQAAHLSIQPNLQAEAIHRIESLLRFNKSKIEQIESHIATKDKKLDNIMEVLEKLRKEAAESNRAVHRVETSVQDVTKNTVEMKADLMGMKAQSGDVKNGMKSVTVVLMNETMEMKNGLQSVTNENMQMKKGIEAVFGELVEMKKRMKSGLSKSVEMQKGIHPKGTEAKESKNSIHTVAAGTQAASKDGWERAMKEMIESMNNGFQSIMAQMQVTRNGIESVMSESRRMNNESGDVKNRILSLLNQYNDGKKETKEIKNGILSVVNKFEDTQKEILSVNKEIKKIKTGILSMKKDSQVIKQDAGKIKSEMRRGAKESKKGMEGMNANILCLLALKLDSDTVGSMDNSDRMFRRESKSARCGRPEEGGSSQRAVPADDSLFSSQPPGREATEMDADVEDSEPEDSLFTRQSSRVQATADITAPLNSNHIMQDSTFSEQMPSRVSSGDLNSKWDPQADDSGDNDSLFEECIPQKNKGSIHNS